MIATHAYWISIGVAVSHVQPTPYRFFCLTTLGWASRSLSLVMPVDCGSGYHMDSNIHPLDRASAGTLSHSTFFIFRRP